MKTCSACKIEKNENEFHNGERVFYCKPCATEKARKYYFDHKEDRRAYARKYYYEDHEKHKKQLRDNYRNNPERMRKCKERAEIYARENPQKVKDSQQKPAGRFSHARQLARQRNIEWKLERQEYVDLVIQPCIYCSSVTINYGVGLDRIDNSKGYEIGNVQPCCGDCNQLRGHRLTVEETKVAMAAILAFRKKEK